MTMSCFGLCASNFGAIAMGPVGAVAGAAASIQGLVLTLGGSLIGAAIGQCFNETVLPLAFGSTLCGLASLLCVVSAERGRLFHPEHA